LIVAGIDYLVPKIHDLLDGVAHSRVIIEDRSRELPRKLEPQDFFKEGSRRFWQLKALGDLAAWLP